MTAQPNSRSVYKGVLEFGALKIPIDIYKAVDIYGFPGNLYHQDCDGKVAMKQFCELHPDDEEIVVFSGISIGDKIVPIGPELRNELLDRKAPFRALSSHRLADLPNLLATCRLVPVEMYRLAVQREDRKIRVVGQNHALFNLLDRLGAKKKFLLCSVPLAGCNRYVALLPGGVLYALAYDEEVRDFEPIEGVKDKEQAAYIEERLAAMASDVPVFSLEKISNKVFSWIMKQVEASKIKRPRTNAKKQKEKVSA